MQLTSLLTEVERYCMLTQNQILNSIVSQSIDNYGKLISVQAFWLVSHLIVLSAKKC